LPPFLLAQTLCLAKASDLGVQALDTVMADFKDLEGLKKECLASKEMGFTGKLAIHPVQLEIINQVFSPTEQEIEFARKVIALFESNPDAGVLQLDGKMLDIPHLHAAERMLARYT
jgi:citrate lyase subunit beta/citryl-CoA lyase